MTDEELLIRFDEYWLFFTSGHLNAGASSEDIVKFWQAMIPHGTSNTLLCYWARKRFKIESAHGMGSKLRDTIDYDEDEDDPEAA